MINSQFCLNIEDITLFKQLKKSVAYKDYIRGVVNSPVYRIIADECINNINIMDDINKLQNEIKLNATELNTIFKNTIRKMTISIIADSIILKEFSDLKIQDALSSMNDINNEINDLFIEKYLLGLADDKFYDQAEIILKDNPNTNGVLFTGLIQYKRRNDTKIKDNPNTNIFEKEIQKKQEIQIKQKVKEKKVNKISIEGNHIRL